MRLLARMSGWLRRAERRAYRRYRGVDLRISLEGRDHPVVDWSLGGIRIKAPASTAAAGERIEGSISFRGCSGEFGAEVLETRDGELSARFLDITPRVLLAMSGLGER